MKVTLVPVLQSLRDIYNVDGVMSRFEAYLSLMGVHNNRNCRQALLNRGEYLPLGAFSPMGRQQPQYLDDLINMDAERIAQEAATKASSDAELECLDDIYRLVLVVVDAPPNKNTWTDRYITDAEWRFENKYDEIPKAVASVVNSQKSLPMFDRFVTVNLWTDIDPTADYIQKETRAAIFRAAHSKHVGVPTTLAEMITQEGRTQAFAGYNFYDAVSKFDEEDLEYSRCVLESSLGSTRHPTCMAALYGDTVARSAGYKPLGLSHLAGFHVGLADATKNEKQQLEGENESCGVLTLCP